MIVDTQDCENNNDGDFLITSYVLKPETSKTAVPCLTLGKQDTLQKWLDPQRSLFGGVVFVFADG